MPVTINGITATSFQAQPAGARVPDVVGNLRYDQPWGAVQLTAAAHQVRASLFEASALTTPAATVAGSTPAYAFPALTSNSYGFAIQGGVQLNADYLSPGDKLWLQAAYEKGASAISRATILASIMARSIRTAMPVPASRRRITAPAGTRSRIPIASSPAAAPARSNRASTSPAPISIIDPGLGRLWFLYASELSRRCAGGLWRRRRHFEHQGRPGRQQSRLDTAQRFDIGAEFMYVNVNQSRPAGLASNAVLNAAGLPSF